MFVRWRPLGLLLAIAPWVVVATNPSGKSKELVAPVWRKPDSLGRACVSCHSPDGIEIAAFAFSDEDVVRRARAHLSGEDSKQIVEMVHAVRRRNHIIRLLDPMKDRPMQPGGALLNGSTPMERDDSFAL